MKGMSKNKKRALVANLESFDLSRAFEEDEDHRKVNLSLGVYRSEHGEAWIIPTVRTVEHMMANDMEIFHDELHPLGDPEFSRSIVDFMFGLNNESIDSEKVFCMQTLSCTGALRIAAEFMFNCLEYRTVYISDPSWENHGSIFQAAGFTDIRRYKYWLADKKTLDFQGMVSDFSEAPANSVIIIQPCAHNPTGCDPTTDQWTALADVFQTRKLFPLFDAAALGLASGSIKTDCQALRIFASRGIEMIVVASFVKNFTIYNERVGALAVVLKNKKYIPAIRSHMFSIVRGMYGSPNYHGMKIIKTILKSDNLYKDWKEWLVSMTVRILEIRLNLEQELIRKHTLGVWDHISKTVGMFCHTGLTLRQVEHLIFYYHIYLMKNGRINVCGLTFDNLYYVAQAIRRTVKQYTF